MTKHILFPIILVVIVILAIGFLTKRLQSKKEGINSNDLQPTKEITINGKDITVEIADTDEIRKKGLSGRKTLDQDHGMLFVFENNNTTPSFWMKDMLISIDIIWIKEGQITQIDASVPTPEPKSKDSDLSLYSPQAPVDYVLEVNAGFCQNNNIKVGDKVGNL